MTNIIDSLPLSQDLLQYYKQKIESWSIEYQNLLSKIDSNSVGDEEHHKLEWNLFSIQNDVKLLQLKLSQSTQALFEERRHVLRALADNDLLKVQELQDRSAQLSASETTYFKESLAKKIVKHDQDQKHESLFNNNDPVLLKNEISSLQLQVEALKTHLSEQQTAHDAQIQSLLNDRAVSAQEAEIHNQHDSAQIKELTTQNQRLRLLCSENTRELLQAKKDMMIWERKLVEEKNQLVDQLNDTRKNLVIQEDRAIDAEKIVEVRIVKKHESLVTELRNLLGKTQQSAHILQTKYDKLESQHLKKQKQLQQKIDLVTQSYIALRKRRDFEIEGFTSEVQLLRRSIKELEKCILKFGPLEDRELILLDIAQRTGLKADKLSSSLVNLKGKVQDLQEQVATVKI